MSQCAKCGAVLPPPGGAAPSKCWSCGHLQGPPSGAPRPPAPPPPPRTAPPPPPRPGSGTAPPGNSAAAPGWTIDLANRKAIHRLPPQVLQSPAQLAVCQDLRQKLTAQPIPGMAVLKQFDPARGTWEWELPADFVPLSAQSGTITSDRLAPLVNDLMQTLAKLHAAGLSVIDFSPELILVHPTQAKVIVLPSPWLALPGNWGGTTTRCVAPEVAKGVPVGGEMRADLHALGQLVFRLLTGRTRAGQGSEFPSDHNPALAPWDAFVDGCCRQWPERRFTSLTGAADQIPLPGKPAATHRRPMSRSRRRLVPAVMLIAVIGLVSLGILGLAAGGVPLNPWNWIVPGVQRGYADTILRYAPRSYEGAKWEVVPEIKALREGTSNNLEFSHIAGWDAENLSVTAQEYDKLVVFRYHDAHWEIFTRIESRQIAPTQRFLSHDTLLLACPSGERAKGIFQISPLGTEDYGAVNFGRGTVTITPLAPDLFFVFDSNDSEKGAIRIDGTKREELDAKLHKSAFVHREDNIPLKEFLIQNIIHTKVDQTGHAIGFAVPVWGGRDAHYRLVEFRAGTWYSIAELTDATRGSADMLPRDLWYSSRGANPFVVWVTDQGHIYRYELGKTVVEQQLPPSSDLTSQKLIRIWGTDLNNYHVMDNNGTVSHWDGEQWQTVVRGLREEDVEFRSAWVSPEGIVFGITKTDLYRLR